MMKWFSWLALTVQLCRMALSSQRWEKTWFPNDRDCFVIFFFSPNAFLNPHVVFFHRLEKRHSKVISLSFDWISRFRLDILLYILQKLVWQINIVGTITSHYGCEDEKVFPKLLKTHNEQLHNKKTPLKYKSFLLLIIRNWLIFEVGEKKVLYPLL